MPNTEGLTKVSIERFNGGRNGKVVAFALPDDQSADGINFRADEVALKFAPGFARLNTVAAAGTSPVRGLARYYRMTGSDRWWLVAAGTTVKKVTDSGTITNYGLNLTRGKQAIFSQLRGRSYMVNGADGVVRILGNTAALLASEYISAPTGPPRILSSEVAINNCDTSANWTAGTTAGGAIGGTVSISTASPWQGTGNLRVLRTGNRSGNWGRRLTGLSLNLSIPRALTAYIRCSHANQVIHLRLKDSTQNWLPSTTSTMGAANVWTRLVFNLSYLTPAQLDNITDIVIFTYEALTATETITLDIDYLLVGDAQGGGTQDSWYIFAFYDSATNKYSLPSPISAVVKINPSQVSNLVQLRGSADTAIDKFYLYRTQGGLTSPYYFVTALNFAASTVVTVRDTVIDNLLGAAYQRTMASGVQAPPTGASIIFQHKHRMAYVDPNDPSKIWWSNLNDAETCPDIEMAESALGLIDRQFRETTGFWHYVDRDNGQRITAGKSVGDVALIVKDRSAYLVYGDSALNVSISKIGDNCGTMSKRSLEFCEGDAIWVDWQNHTIWKWNDAEGLKDIGLPISDILKQITQSDAANICTIYHDRRAVISYKRGSVQEWIEYDFRTGTWYDQGGEIIRSGFMKFRGQDRQIMAVAGGPNDSGYLAYGDATGHVLKQTDATVVNGSTGISGIWLGKAFDYKDTGRQHRVRFVDIEGQGVVSNTASQVPRIKVGFFYESLGTAKSTPQWTAGFAPTAAFVQRRISVPSKVKGYRIQPYIACAGKTAIEIHRMTMWVSPVR